MAESLTEILDARPTRRARATPSAARPRSSACAHASTRPPRATSSSSTTSAAGTGSARPLAPRRPGRSRGRPTARDPSCTGTSPENCALTSENTKSVSSSPDQPALSPPRASRPSSRTITEITNAASASRPEHAELGADLQHDVVRVQRAVSSRWPRSRPCRCRRACASGSPRRTRACASPQRMKRDVSPASCVVWKIESERCVASGGTSATTATTASAPTATSDEREALGDGRARGAPEQHGGQRDDHADHGSARARADERDRDGREREAHQHPVRTVCGAHEQEEQDQRDLAHRAPQPDHVDRRVQRVAVGELLVGAAAGDQDTSCRAPPPTAIAT